MALPGGGMEKGKISLALFWEQGLGREGLALQGSSRGNCTQQQGQSPRKPAESRAQLRPCWCLVLRWRMLLAAGGADSPGTGRNSQGKC